MPRWPRHAVARRRGRNQNTGKLLSLSSAALGSPTRLGAVSRADSARSGGRWSDRGKPDSESDRDAAGRAA